MAGNPFADIPITKAQAAPAANPFADIPVTGPTESQLAEPPIAVDPMTGMPIGGGLQKPAEEATTRLGAAMADPTVSMLGGMGQLASGAFELVGAKDPWLLQQFNKLYPKWEEARNKMGRDQLTGPAELVGEAIPLAFAGGTEAVGKLFGSAVKTIPKILARGAAGAVAGTRAGEDSSDVAFNTALAAIGGVAVPAAVSKVGTKILASRGIKQIVGMAKDLAQHFDEQSSEMSTLFQKEFQSRQDQTSTKFRNAIRAGLQYIKPGTNVSSGQNILGMLNVYDPKKFDKAYQFLKDNIDTSQAPNGVKRAVKDALSYYEEGFGPFSSTKRLAKSRLADWGMNTGSSWKDASNEMLKIAGGDDKTVAMDLFRFAPTKLKDKIRQGLLQRALSAATKDDKLDPKKFMAALDTAGHRIFLDTPASKNIVSNLEALINTSSSPDHGFIRHLTQSHPYATTRLILPLIGGGAGFHEGGVEGAVLGTLAVTYALEKVLGTEWGMRLLASTSKIKPNSPQSIRLLDALISRSAGTSGLAVTGLNPGS